MAEIYGFVTVWALSIQSQRDNLEDLNSFPENNYL